MKSDPNWRPNKILSVKFYKSETGNEPVREWLKSLSKHQRKIIGEDIKTVQYGWPLGMPLVRNLEPKIWEIRCNFPEGISRIFFTFWKEHLILLHGFIKKTQKTPVKELDIARKRMKSMEK